MAGDWIKMRCNLWTHPKVVTLASRLGVTRAQVIGALHGSWALMDQHGDDGKLNHFTAEALDKHIETEGFAAAMAAIGWLEVGESSLQFPMYQEHNGDTAKQRAQSAKRKSESRKRHANVTVKRDNSVTREEKRREDICVSKDTHKGFAPPTSEEAAAYADTIGYTLDAEQFIASYEQKGWMVGKNKMKDWKAAVRNWKANKWGLKQGSSKCQVPTQDDLDNYSPHG